MSKLTSRILISKLQNGYACEQRNMHALQIGTKLRQLCVYFSIGFAVLALSIGASAQDVIGRKSPTDNSTNIAILRQADSELNAVYREVMAIPDLDMREKVRIAQRQWLNQRDRECDISATSPNYERWLAALAQDTTKTTCMSKLTGKRTAALKRFVSDINRFNLTADSLRSIGLNPGGSFRSYRFTLSRGKSLEVCNAYVERLNSSTFEEYPYCDRPENDRVAGFQFLQRVPLSEEEIRRYGDGVAGFLGANDSKAAEKRAIDRARRGLSPISTEGNTFSRHQSDAIRARSYSGYNYPGVFYRFEPKLDIDNDGTPDEVIVWKETDRVCGAEYNGFPTRSATHLVLIDAKGEVDELKTRSIFAHPKGEMLVYRDSNTGQKTEIKKASRDFRAIGNTQGVVEFKEKVYFDTFYAPGGDMNNERDGSRGYLDTLALFLKEGKRPTELVCEVIWQDPNKSIPNK